MSPQHPNLTAVGLWVDHDANVLICRHENCKTALSVEGSRPTTHLGDKHKIPLEHRRGLTKVLRGLKLFSPGSEKISPREDGSPAHPHLQIDDGYHCSACGERSVNLQHIKRHYSNPNPTDKVCPAAAQGRPADIDSLIEFVYLQTWCRGPAAQHWLVSCEGQTIRPVLPPKAKSHIESVRERELARHAYPSTEQASPNTTSTLAFGEQRPWIERTGWERMFKGRDRNVLSTMLSLPWHRRTQPPLQLALPGTPRFEEGLVITAEDETKIAHLLSLVNPMMERCDETVRKTSRNLLSWLKSVRPLSSSPDPF